MKERIIQLMEHEHLKQAQFAEAIGIQRAAMSHIISGRNNASLDVLTKILTRYPEVSPDWLLFGQGAMFREAQPQNEDNISGESSLFSENRQDSGLGMAQNADKPIEKETVITIEKPAKAISKIMVFYSDSTFDTFVLEKK